MTQGLEANLTKWATARKSRVRDPVMVPYLRALRPFGDVNPSDVIPPECHELPVPIIHRSGRSHVSSTDVLESHPANAGSGFQATQHRRSRTPHTYLRVVVLDRFSL
jgi:hypothetical protein